MGEDGGYPENEGAYETALRQVQQEEYEDYLREAISTYSGRVLVNTMLELTGFELGTFDGEKPLTMARNEGMREVGRRIKATLLQIAPNEFRMIEIELAERCARWDKQMRDLDMEERDDG